MISIYEQNDPEYRSLDRRFVALEKISSLIFATVVMIGGGIGMTIWWFSSTANWVWWLVLGCAVLVVAVLYWLALVWPKWDFAYSAWRMDDLGLEIRKGVFWRHRISVPVARVQHADVSQGPIQRRFGLGTLTVHTAGTHNATVILDGLAHEVAIELRDNLIRQREISDVV